MIKVKGETNLYDGGDAMAISLANTHGDNTIFTGRGAASSTSYCMECLPNTTYRLTISGDTTGLNIWRAATTVEKLEPTTSGDDITMTVVQKVMKSSYSEIVINSGENAHYIYFQTNGGLFNTLKSRIKVEGLAMADVKEIHIKKDGVMKDIIEKYKNGHRVFRKALPAGYKELTYIESSGTQYIDTGFLPDTTAGFEYDFAMVGGLPADAFVMGVRQLSTTASRWTTTITSGQIYCGFGDNPSASQRQPYETGVRTIMKNNLYDSKTMAKDEDKFFDIPDTSTLPNFTYTAVIAGAVNNSGNITNFWPQRVYSCKMTRENILERYFVPAKNAQGVVGMYDLVTDTFYTNQGTGNFIAGEEV